MEIIPVCDVTWYVQNARRWAKSRNLLLLLTIKIWLNAFCIEVKNMMHEF
jgi:hypothetical protein